MTGPREPKALTETWTTPMQGGQGNVAGQHNTQVNTWVTPITVKAPHEVSPPVGVHNLPPASKVFVGRDLDQLDEILGRNPSGVVVGQVAIHGLGGIGKTELVTHYAHRHRERFRLVWWITADNEDNIALGLARLTTRLQSTVAVAHAQEWAVGWLQAHAGWLLILDNVENIEHIRPLLGQVTGKGHVLVTTRRDPAATGWAPLGLEPLRLDPLNRDASIDLLIRLTGNDDREGADALAEDLGDLPLALEQAAAYIARHRGMEFRSYRKALATRFHKVSRHGGRDGNTERTIAQVWRVTMSTIAEQSPLARTVLDVLAWLAPERLPQEVLYPLAGDADEVLDAVALLAGHNMIKYQDFGISTHRVVQAVTRASHDDPANPITGPAAHAVELLDSAVPTRNPWNVVADWPTWNSLLSHIDSLYSAMPKGHRNTRLHNLANRAALYRQGQGQVTHAIALLEQVVAGYRQLLGNEHLDTLRARHSLAIAYHSAGRLAEAIALHEQGIADFRRVLGDDHPHTLAAQHNLAVTYVAAGRVADAITLHELVLAHRRAVLGDDHLETLRSRHNLAEALRSAGRTTEAISLIEPVLVDLRQKLGENHPDTLRARQNLAISYTADGRTKESITMHEEVTGDIRRIFGDDHPDTLRARHNLANAYRLAGRIGEAVALSEQVLADFSRIVGDDNPDTLRARHILAASYLSAGRIAESVDQHERVFAGCARILSADHPDTHTAARALRAARARLPRQR